MTHKTLLPDHNDHHQLAPDILMRMQVVERLLANFKPERILNIIITVLSLIILITCVILFFSAKIPDTAAACGMCGSSGGIAATQGRLFKMWGDAMKIILH
jgi:hypothetical protein